MAVGNHLKPHLRPRMNRLRQFTAARLPAEGKRTLACHLKIFMCKAPSATAVASALTAAGADVAVEAEGAAPFVEPELRSKRVPGAVNLNPCPTVAESAREGHFRKDEGSWISHLWQDW